ncbi:MAG: hypothetical protein ABFC62_12390 [Clostridiaceae bacterium]
MGSNTISVCPHCGATDIGIGYQLGAGQLYADLYAYHASGECCNVEHLLCKSCGAILHSRAVRPELFRSHTRAREQELFDHLEAHGILLCNTSKDMPSLDSLGYTMEHIAGLIERHEVFYCTAYKKRSTYLSRRAYRLLLRARGRYEPKGEEKPVYDALRRRELAQKDELRSDTGLEKQAFDKAFNALLENLTVTAFSGTRLNHNWYGYVYCTAERWEKESEGLHTNADPKEELKKLFDGVMDEKSMALLWK